MASFVDTRMNTQKIIHFCLLHTWQWYVVHMRDGKTCSPEFRQAMEEIPSILAKIGWKPPPDRADHE